MGSGVRTRIVKTGGKHLHLLSHLSLGFILKLGAWVYFAEGRKRNISKGETCFYELGVLFAGDVGNQRNVNVKTDKKQNKKHQ